jgi:hypothetical protein
MFGEDDFPPESHPRCGCRDQTGQWLLGFDTGGPELVHSVCGRPLAGEWFKNAALDGEAAVHLAKEGWTSFGFDGPDMGYAFAVAPWSSDELGPDAYNCTCGNSDTTWCLRMALGGVVTLTHRPCGTSPHEGDWGYFSTSEGIPVEVTFPDITGLPIWLIVVEEPTVVPFRLDQYYMLFGDDEATVHCRICSDGIFDEPGDRYYATVEQGAPISAVAEMAQRHHDRQHTHAGETE